MAMPTLVAPPESRSRSTAPVEPAARPRRTEPFEIIAVVISVVFAIACIVPFWLVVSSSLTSERELVAHGYTLWPREFSLDAYRALLTGPRVAQAYGASACITVIGTAIAVVITAALAYVIAIRIPVVSKGLTGLTYLPMLFNGGLVPFYILVTQILRLQDSLWAVILPNLVTPFLVLVTVAYLRGLPAELFESARIDGASELRILFSIVLPLAKPILATIGLFYALHYWNEWFMALLFLTDPNKFPLQLLLQNMIANVGSAEAMQVGATADVPIFQLRMALVVITIGPIVLAYPFVQRYFVQGLTLGATKG